MIRRVIVLVAACALPAFAALAEEGAAPSVDEMSFCTAVQDRAPAGVDTAFASTVENVYCYVKTSGAAGTSVVHVWYFGDREMARVELAVNGSPWRTWSSKKILPEWQGGWRVDVLSAAGDVLKSGTFVVRP
ncbi:MAG: DUF2914 domain-containing protein [Candidatus Latescibacterota bacterium]|jgi:hypothetical protein|nr:MAG: DUF2914 domain-containing protein [Candidatus Latescibacterota bacterium]